MAKRPRPDMNQVRDAFRDRDERSDTTEAAETPAPEPEPEPEAEDDDEE
jgi:hypothetical protein